LQIVSKSVSGFDLYPALLHEQPYRIDRETFSCMQDASSDYRASLSWREAAPFSAPTNHFFSMVECRYQREKRGKANRLSFVCLIGIPAAVR
jgi:hypothetical protein